MESSVIISLIALAMSFIINVGSICFFAGKITTVIDNMKEDFARLESKQDKHNNLIERMAIVEQSVKSSHHRQDELTDRVQLIERQLL